METANVRALVTLRESTGCPTGLSDHTRDPIVAPVAAVALGAAVIEKHFTLDRNLPGPDHRYAIEPQELERMVVAIRAAQAALGHGRKEVLPVERELRHFARRSVFASKPIAAGEIFSRDNILVLRCGQHAPGLPPAAFDELIGKTAARAIPADRPIQPEDVV
jgi:N-acetylneuraminate synthase